MLTQNAAPAAVSATLAMGTVQAAVLTAAGQAATGAIPATVAALTEGVLRAMLLSKLKVVVAVMLAVTVAAVGTVVCAQRALTDKPAAAGKEEAPKVEEKFVGTWAIVSLEWGGQKLPEQAFEEGKWSFTADGKMTGRMRAGARELVGIYKLGPTKKPQEIDFTTDDEKTTPGIYKLDGANLTICLSDEFGRAGDGRPTEFATKEGTKVWLIVFKREEK